MYTQIEKEDFLICMIIEYLYIPLRLYTFDNIFLLMFLDNPIIPNCNATYGAFNTHEVELQTYANANIETSFEFLLLSTHFGNYETNRDGFKGLYRKLSDQSWNDGIDLMKYIAQRGGKMNFNQFSRFKKNVNVIFLCLVSVLEKGYVMIHTIVHRSRKTMY